MNWALEDQQVVGEGRISGGAFINDTRFNKTVASSPRSNINPASVKFSDLGLFHDDLAFPRDPVLKKKMRVGNERWGGESNDIPRVGASLGSGFFVADRGVSSCRRVARFKLSGRIKYRTLLPRMVRKSRFMGFLPRSVIFTVFRCVFILISTPDPHLL